MTCKFGQDWGNEDRTLRFIMLKTCIAGVGGYREDQVFLVVPDASTFRSHVPSYWVHLPSEG